MEIETENRTDGNSYVHGSSVSYYIGHLTDVASTLNCLNIDVHDPSFG